MKNKHKLFLLFVPMLLLLSGCGVKEYQLVTEWGQGFWQNFVYIFSWMIVKSAVIFNGNLVVGLIITTLIIRIVMIPLFAAQIKSSEAMQLIQPEMKKVQAKYKDKKDKESQMKMQQETQALYKKHGVNPFAGCLPMLIQMPMLFVFYGAIQNLFLYSESATSEVVGAAAYYANEGQVFTTTLPLLGDMGQPSIVVAALAAITTWGSTKVTMMGQDQNAQGAGMMKSMSIMMPLMILMFGFTMPGAMAVYWLTGNTIQIAQTLYFKRHKIKEYQDKKALNK